MFEARIDFGNIVLPTGVERAAYIKYALRTHTACVMTRDGTFYKNCNIALSFVGVNDGVMHSLDFPTENEHLGSSVVLLRLHSMGVCIIIGCLKQRDAQFSLEEEHSFKCVRNTNTGSIYIQGRALSGIVDLIASGQLNVDVHNSAKTGVIKLRADVFNFFGDSHYINVSNLAQIKATDLTIDNTEMVLEVNTTGISLGKATKSSKTVLLGEDDNNWKKKLCNVLAQLTVPTAFGASGVPINLANIQELATDAELKPLLSTIVTIEK